jgi:ABC-type multidrug transport system ATPase subunit
MKEVTKDQQRKLRNHFGFSKLPFCKTIWAAHMFDSTGQRELLHSLRLWAEVKGLALVTGPSGVGKSITLRRFCQQLDETRYSIIDFRYVSVRWGASRRCWSEDEMVADAGEGLGVFAGGLPGVWEQLRSVS